MLASRSSSSSASPVELDRRSAVCLAVRDWLETQAHIIGYWRDVLVSSDGDVALIEALDAHAAFLDGAARE